ncbi:hypothetical protein [Blastococcus sp. SYSU DS0539]
MGSSRRVMPIFTRLVMFTVDRLRELVAERRLTCSIPNFLDD